jgi:hypothetical protein
MPLTRTFVTPQDAPTNQSCSTACYGLFINARPRQARRPQSAFSPSRFRACALPLRSKCDILIENPKLSGQEPLRHHREAFVMRSMERAGRNLGRVAAIFIATALFVACVPAVARADADKIKLGVGTGGVGHLAIAQEQGYFAAENLTVEFVHFEAAEPIAVAVAAGSVDFGATGLSGALYSLGAQGLIKIIAGSISEVPGFQFLTFVVSNQAYAAGWTQFKDLGGHAVAVPQIGSPSHYSLALIAEKYHVDLAGVRVLPVQSVPNSISAATGGQADAAIIPIPSVTP